MKRIPPSQKIRYQINELLNHRLDGEEEVTVDAYSDEEKRVMRRIVQECAEELAARKRVP